MQQSTHALTQSFFFNFLEELFVFFTSSTARYEILSANLSSIKGSNSVKRLSDTRWSSRADATKSVKVGFVPIRNALCSIRDDSEQKDVVRSQARGLAKTMESLETAIYVIFWHDILERFHLTIKSLQNPAITLRTAVNSLVSLQSFVKSKRDAFDTYEEAAKDLSEVSDYENVRVRSANVRLQPLGSQVSAVQLSARDKFRTEAFLPVIDKLTSALEDKISCYKLVFERFNFIGELMLMESEDINLHAKKLVETYPNDLESSLGNELIQLRDFAYLHEKRENESTELFLYRIIKENNLQSTFVNSEIILRLYLSMMVTNCTSERSFSKMKLIKSRLRTCMGETRLVHLVLLSSERNILCELSFDDIIAVFAAKKSRKESFQ
ncbi:PREDICTED: uncharacterized protein LOC108360188 [Rhagoletis zephyria]|uniref:uncharacterized protein LOC108360188 n=1 Tax=Rhagoletis zephyria TaxID=28612 RepID=UPI0008117579|nr:PREDICTED: uncharacterized protein LOC108360188 [Rhagoletis zephyria]